jgi:hypothetical protein
VILKWQSAKKQRQKNYYEIFLQTKELTKLFIEGKNMKRSFYVLLSIFSGYAFAYDLPAVGLGYSNFLDGGDLRPDPGWYWYQWAQRYTTDKFLDNCGNELGNVPSPRFKNWSTVFLLLYEAEPIAKLKAMPGVDFFLPVVLSSKIQMPNNLGLRSVGKGIGDAGLGFFLQWLPVKCRGREFFITRIELDFFFPTGKYCCNQDVIQNVITPGNNLFYISAYWAGTIYMTRLFSFSWRANHVWCATNHITKRQPGHCVFFNYNLAYQIAPKFFVGISGYYLKQLTDSKFMGEKVPGRKEQVLGIGPGALWSPTDSLTLIANFFVEKRARNLTQGKNLVLRLIQYF